jgi:hypothetical protein
MDSKVVRRLAVSLCERCGSALRMEKGVEGAILV